MWRRTFLGPLPTTTEIATVAGSEFKVQSIHQPPSPYSALSFHLISNCRGMKYDELCQLGSSVAVTCPRRISLARQFDIVEMGDRDIVFLKQLWACKL